ncbi:MAG: peroxide stress protein YaaA [Gammaproteobacteria bacterium]|nr:peroxide stress protein YaaA [Gammaproteobacteria bacterium]
MLIVISPAKTLDFDTPPTTQKFTQAPFLEESEELIKSLKKRDAHELQTLMSISEKLAVLNLQRYKTWKTPFTPDNAKQALFAFQGDVYTGLNASNLDPKAINYLQSHLFILSGLYGLLRPLDLMQAYRLEMGTRLETQKGKNLYQFWGTKITDALNAQLRKQQAPILINLASNEYFKSIKTKQLNTEIITPVFKDYKNGQYKVISFLAKKARGAMVNYLAVEGVKEAQGIKEFNAGGYAYQADLSSGSEWVFTRNLTE